MAYSEVEIIAIIFAIGIIVKVLFVFQKKKSYIEWVKKMYKNPTLLVVIELAVAALVFYYLQMQMTIIQIFACLILGALLTGMTFAVYAKQLAPNMLSILKKRDAMKKAWLPILIWLVLAVWALKEVFF
ncbi:MAG: hypothetical protein ABIB79_02680 [archaeon]